MAKKNIFRDFIWEKDGNGNYIVTSVYTGKSIIAIPRLDKKNMYCIENSTETELNFFGQEIPKRYNKFEVMAYLQNLDKEE